MTITDQYDALDCLSGFTKNLDGSIKSPFPVLLEQSLATLPIETQNQLFEAHKAQVILEINTLPETERGNVIGTWLHQRFLRDHQKEWVENASDDHAKEALEMLASHGILIPELAVK
jgi:hypothetical protein